MICIKEIKIKNFRSISQASIVLSHLSIFVGRNDQGKSNVLRALNLFFNGSTDFGRPFRFSDDYAKDPQVSQGKAQEISIELIVELPKSYKSSAIDEQGAAIRQIRWKKTWRTSGFHAEEQKFLNGDEITGTSKIPTFLQKIRYEYVPAIKDTRFIEDLQGRVYDTLAQVASAAIRESSSQFEREVQAHTNELLAGLSVFGANNEIKLPKDLRSIFEKLEFNADGVPLFLRGDGIKVRHIPIILRFLSQKENSVLGSGAIRPTVIWGFEEPENNIEFGSSFELAEDFLNFVRKDLQAVITTHSPAFYSIPRFEGAEGLALTYATKKIEKRTTFSDQEREAIDLEIGLMPVVAPYIAKINEKKTELERIISSMRDKDKPTIFVEGQSEKIIFDRLSSVEQYRWLSTIHITCGDGTAYGSADAVKNRCHAWLLIQKHERRPNMAVGLFDDDAAGKSAASDLTNTIGSHTHLARAVSLKSNPFLGQIRRSGFNIPIDLEMVYSDDIWQYANAHEMLVDRDNLRDLIGGNLLDNLIRNGQSPLERLTAETRLRVEKTVANDKKVPLARHIEGLPDDAILSALPHFDKPLAALRAVFRNVTPPQ